MNSKLVKLFLRLAISAGFLSAVADRFGLWSKENSVWGNWENFLAYTKVLNPMIPESLISPVGFIATALEIIFPLFLLIGFKTELFAKLSGCLLLLFGFSMILSIGIKAPLDYSVFTSAAACFALSLLKEKYLEVDSLI
ncbi:DoxX family protein [Flavobacterium sp. MC2016-06]|jgi:thiosulfate dehydrogenase [quinone] large subunit|uniref:DoxX family protein n=1 Tax=Flavobacterium sp. MC2016-06 TaxID=2676308 RepID=UPI0012BA8345|nr:DoxX family protein [Flavobacterium sp. MC2016-06]MBU3861024.1 DoxX family protein [Flavobacterium sp. MC2016-06]